MFAYIDPTVNLRLHERGVIKDLKEDGNLCVQVDDKPFLSLLGPVPLPRKSGNNTAVFNWYSFVRKTAFASIEEAVIKVREKGPKELYSLLSANMPVNSILTLGDFENAKNPLVRVHSCCFTGDIMGSMRCECGPQLNTAFDQIYKEGTGALIYMYGHEGRGIGLWAKAITYLLQDAGEDTYQANEKLGLPKDSRDFSDAARILTHFRPKNKSIRLLGNNPGKRKALEEFNIIVEEQIPLIEGVSEYNLRYLNSKREHGHIIPKESLEKVNTGD